MNEDVKKFNVMLYNGSKNTIKQNKNTPVPNTNTSKLNILNELKDKFNYATNLATFKRGPSSLIYFTVFGVDYSMLLELCLKSLAKNNLSNSFDILFLTDTRTLKIIRTFEILKHFNWKYFLLPTPQDGVEASMVKTKIFLYPEINCYGKILFLDADIICRGDFTDIFSYSPKEKIEVVKSPLIKREFTGFTNLYKSAVLSHSLSFFTESDQEYILKHNPPVFNAGHFYFENTEQMEQHFKNINWLIDVWPAAYFYEQSFMNHYFNLYGLSSYELLDKYIIVTMHVPIMGVEQKKELEKQHEDTNMLIHFAGTPTWGRNKYQFIKQYCNYFNICL